MSLDTHAFEDSTSAKNHKSPFGEAGLMFDPLAYLFGKKYKNFMRKTWEIPNEKVGGVLKKFNKFDRKVNPIHRAIDRTAIGAKVKDYAENKPGDSLMAVLGAVYGGGALLGGGAAGGSGTAGVTGGTSGSTLGGLGGGTAGATGGAGTGSAVGASSAAELAAMPEIVVTGTSAGGGAGAALGGLGGGAGAAAQAAQPQQPQTQEQQQQKDWKDRMQEQQPGDENDQQRQQQSPYEGRAAALERERQKREADELAKRQQLAAAMRAQGMYTPA